MCFDAKLNLEKDKCNAWVIKLFLDNLVSWRPSYLTLSWFKGLCCVCQIWKILHYVILYCGRLLIGIFHIQKFSRYVRKLPILLTYCCPKCNVLSTPFPTSGTIIKTCIKSLLSCQKTFNIYRSFSITGNYGRRSFSKYGISYYNLM
jgi:hypothetical protein